MHISVSANNKAGINGNRVDAQSIFVIAWLITIFKAEQDNAQFVYGCSRSN